MTRVEAPARLHFGLLAVPIAGEGVYEAYRELSRQLSGTKPPK